MAREGRRSGRESPRRESKVRSSETVGKNVKFDEQTWQILDLLARDRMMTFQELADEAFLDLLRKHNRPYDTRDALKRSARLAQANDNPVKGLKSGRKNKRPAKGRARS
jgi:hypothetical protein